jgi:hypothetical protein
VYITINASRRLYTRDEHSATQSQTEKS